jgi:hypothetical protein
MANWLIVAVAIAMATIFIGGFYQLVSVHGTKRYVLNGQQHDNGDTTVCVPQGCRKLGELPAHAK